MGGEFGGEWIHEYVWLSPFAVHLKLTTLLTDYVCVCVCVCVLFTQSYLTL